MGSSSNDDSSRDDDASYRSIAGSGADPQRPVAAAPQPWRAHTDATNDKTEATAAEESEAAATATHRRHALTPDQRVLICAHSAVHPKMTQHMLAAWAKQTFALRVEPSQSAISSILQRGRHASWNAVAPAPRTNRTKKKRRVKYPKLDDELLKWVLSCDLHDIKVSGARVKQRAAALCEKYKIPAAARPSFSNGWLASFNRRHGLKRFKRDPTRKSTYATDSDESDSGNDNNDDDDDDDDDANARLAALESEYNELLHRDHEHDYNDSDPVERDDSSTGSDNQSLAAVRERQRAWRRRRIAELAELVAAERINAERRRVDRIAAKRAAAKHSRAEAEAAAAAAVPVWNEATETELLASKREAELRIEGLRYDNSVKRIRVLEENMLTRKRLRDAGLSDEDIDRLMPLPQLDVSSPEL